MNHTLHYISDTSHLKRLSLGDQNLTDVITYLNRGVPDSLVRTIEIGDGENHRTIEIGDLIFIDGAIRETLTFRELVTNDEFEEQRLELILDLVTQRFGGWRRRTARESQSRHRGRTRRFERTEDELTDVLLAVIDVVTHITRSLDPDADQIRILNDLSSDLQRR